MIFVSRSKFFLDGVTRIIGEKLGNVKIATRSSGRGIKSLLNGIKPEVLFLDNRSLQLDTKKFLDLIIKEGPHTKVIMFSNQTKQKIGLPNITYISKRTTSSELISIIKRKKRVNGNSSSKKREIEHKAYRKSRPS